MYLLCSHAATQAPSFSRNRSALMSASLFLALVPCYLLSAPALNLYPENAASNLTLQFNLSGSSVLTGYPDMATFMATL